MKTVMDRFLNYVTYDTQSNPEFTKQHLRLHHS